MEWKITRQLDLQATPLDIATSADGRWILILTPGEVLIYSVGEDEVINHIPVDPTFDKLTYSTKNNTVILTSHSKKSMKIIQLDVIRDISVSGLPFHGPEHASVTVAVFDDYQ